MRSQILYIVLAICLNSCDFRSNKSHQRDFGTEGLDSVSQGKELTNSDINELKKKFGWEPFKSTYFDSISNRAQDFNYCISDYLKVPEGYARIMPEPGSFGEFIQSQPISSDNNIYMHYGSILKSNEHIGILKNYQDVHEFEQCADLIMHMVADYNASKNRTTTFTTSKKNKKTGTNTTRMLYDWYVHCNTESLMYHDTEPVSLNDVMPGDLLLITDTSPGHVVIIIDVVKKGEKVKVALAQGHMPAMSCHIVAYRDNPYFVIDDTIEIYGNLFTTKLHLRRIKQI